MKKKKVLMTSLLILGVLFITAGITYAFYSYSDLGNKENSVEVGSIKFIYNESDRIGNGISLTDAMPIDDYDADESENYFEFSVMGTSGNFVLPYEITLRKTDESDDLDNYIKVYLSEVSDTDVETDDEEEKVLSMYNDLSESENEIAKINHEKTLYESNISKNQTDHVDYYRLRMWLNNDSNDGDILNYTQTITGSCSDSTYTTEEDCISHNKDWTEVATANTKTFKIKVNVYAKAIDTRNFAAGLYDEGYNLKYTWQELLDNNYIEVENGEIISSDTDEIIGNLIIDDGVTIIGEDAFRNCSRLTSVVIPNSVTNIDGWAFCNCWRLKSITIPSSVISIGKAAFSSTYNVETITFEPNSHLTTIGEAAFEDIYELTSITIPASVTAIDGWAFNDCHALTTVIFEPNSHLTTIGDGAFEITNLSSITIPASVTSIGEGAFCFDENLTSITVDSNNSVYDSRNNSNAIIETATNNLIAGCKTTTIPNTVTSIDGWAFASTDLESVIIPSSVISIGSHAFYRNDNLTSITMPASVTTIGTNAFELCENLTTVTFEPNSQLTSIGESAFSNTGLTAITIPANVNSIGTFAFSTCTNLKNATFTNPNGWSGSLLNSNTINFNATDLSNTSIAATYLANRSYYSTPGYANYTWTRSD